MELWNTQKGKACTHLDLAEHDIIVDTLNDHILKSETRRNGYLRWDDGSPPERESSSVRRQHSTKDTDCELIRAGPSSHQTRRYCSASVPQCGYRVKLQLNDH